MKPTNRVLTLAVVAAGLLMPTVAHGATIKIPTGYGGVQYRPHVITVSADGSSFFGGATGHQLVPRRRSPSDLGHLHWTQYSASSARATGVVWGLYGPGPFNADTEFQLEGKVKLHAYRPLNGVFTRLTIDMGPQTLRTAGGRVFHSNGGQSTVKAQQSGGIWCWCG